MGLPPCRVALVASTVSSSLFAWYLTSFLLLPHHPLATPCCFSVGDSALIAPVCRALLPVHLPGRPRSTSPAQACCSVQAPCHAGPHLELPVQDAARRPTAAYVDGAASASDRMHCERSGSLQRTLSALVNLCRTYAPEPLCMCTAPAHHLLLFDALRCLGPIYCYALGISLHCLHAKQRSWGLQRQKRAGTQSFGPRRNAGKGRRWYLQGAGRWADAARRTDGLQPTAVG